MGELKISAKHIKQLEIKIKLYMVRNQCTILLHELLRKSQIKMKKENHKVIFKHAALSATL